MKYLFFSTRNAADILIVTARIIMSTRKNVKTLALGLTKTSSKRKINSAKKKSIKVQSHLWEITHFIWLFWLSIYSSLQYMLIITPTIKNTSCIPHIPTDINQKSFHCSSMTSSKYEHINPTKNDITTWTSRYRDILYCYTKTVHVNAREDREKYFVCTYDFLRAVRLEFDLRRARDVGDR